MFSKVKGNVNTLQDIFEKVDQLAKFGQSLIKSPNNTVYI